MINSLIHGVLPPSVVAEGLADGLALRALGPDVGGGPFCPDIAPAHTESVRYVNAETGDDGASGNTVDAPWLTLAKGLAWLQRMEGMDRSAILELSGDFVWPSQLDVGGFDLGATDGTLDFAAVGPDNFGFKSQRQIRARLVEVTDVTVLSSTPDPETGLHLAVEVTEVNADHSLRGKFIVGEGFGEYAAISDNFAGEGNFVSCCTSWDPGTWTGDVKVYQCGASITAGVVADSFSLGTRLLALTDWAFSGISFRSADAAAQPCALSLFGNQIVNLQLCDVAGLQVASGAYAVMYGCVVRDQFLTVDGGSLLWNNSAFLELEILCHAGGCFADVVECVFDACTQPWGGGVGLSHFQYAALRSHFQNADGCSGVRIAHGISRLTDCRVSDNGLDGIEVSDGAQAVLANVSGSGNGGFGVRVTNGSQIRATGGTNLTGTSGDVSLGAAGSKAWGTAPQTDLASGVTSQLCRMS